LQNIFIINDKKSFRGEFGGLGILLFTASASLFGEILGLIIGSNPINYVEYNFIGISDDQKRKIIIEEILKKTCDVS
jgi:hypothetical protein